MTQPEYCFPIKVSKGYFAKTGLAIPKYHDWLRHYYIHYLRYLDYLLTKNPDYRVRAFNHLSNEEIEKEINDLTNRIQSCVCTDRLIKKILIGEAPPFFYKTPSSPFGCDYFYNPNGPWPESSPWYHAPYTAIFGSAVKLPGSKIDFLKQLADVGYLLLDLFPYPLKFSGTRNTVKYKDACTSAYGGVPNKYLFTIIDLLYNLKKCLSHNLAFGFGMKGFGEPILNNTSCVSAIGNFLLCNGISLLPNCGSIATTRAMLPSPLGKANSNYLHIVSDKSGNPNKDLMQQAGF